VLEGVSDIAAIPSEPRGPGQADIVLRFAGSEYPVLVEVKNRGNAAAAWQMVHYLEALPGSHGILIADETTAEARSILRDHGVGLIDGLGNTHLELPGLLLHLEGKRAASPTRRVRLSGKAGVAAQALLAGAGRQWRVTELAEQAGISPALAHRVLARLGREGITRTEGAGPRQIRVIEDPSALLDLWAEEENTKIAERIPLFILGQTERLRMSKVADALEAAKLNYAVTGAAAAAMTAPLVTAVPVVETWVSASATVKQILAATQSMTVLEGPNVVLLQSKDDTPLAFSQKRGTVRITNPFRTYVDLRRDPRRGIEQAEHLRGEVIGF
jgi:IclR-like helix-turn-helix domain-containing protein